MNDINDAGARGHNILGNYCIGKRDFTGENLCLIQLYGAELREVNLSRANLQQASLTRINLQGSDLSQR
ncbi:pentapeptide repeat-containing protein [Nostoc linckia FACHB-104]|nr:pentapeptide repeat-containing protein [Nostoc linckia FACHB-104]